MHGPALATGTAAVPDVTLNSGWDRWRRVLRAGTTGSRARSGVLRRSGASEGIRTLDTHVGNVMLYQAELRSHPDSVVD